MFLVGLTGGIASGKSFVSSIIRNLGVEIIDADVISREVVEPGKRAWRKIRLEFGEAVFHPDGTYNRQAMGQIIFKDPERRACLNRIIHPEIYKSIMYRCLYLFVTGHQFVVLDLPLLYESGRMVRYMHKTIVVTCDPAQQSERLMLRNNFSEVEASERISAQMPLEEKVKHADYVIYNNETKQNTEAQVEQIIEQLRSSKTHWKYRIAVFGCVAIITAGLCYGGFILIKLCAF